MTGEPMTPDRCTRPHVGADCASGHIVGAIPRRKPRTSVVGAEVLTAAQARDRHAATCPFKQGAQLARDLELTRRQLAEARALADAYAADSRYWRERATARLAALWAVRDDLNRARKLQPAADP